MTSSLIENLPAAFPKPTPNQFIESLYTLIESQEYRHMINWSESNDNSFTIYKPHVFAQVLLPNLCKHSNLDSFIRQLNMYCFKKYRSKAHSDSISYSHPYFVRGQKELLNNVIRKNPRRILKQKEAQLRGLGIETRSSTSTASREQEYEESKRTASTTPSTPSMKQNAFYQDKSETNNSNSSDVYGYLMQLMNKMNTKCDQNAMNMIRNYLNDDDEEEYESAAAYGYKKIKYSTEEQTQQQLLSNSQYVQMDVNTLDFKPFRSTESKEILNSQSPITTQIFNGKDFVRCQNLIQNLYEVQSKNADSYSYGSESTQSYLQELISWKTGDYCEENLY